MKRSTVILAALATSAMFATPAHATFGHTHYCNCGHSGGSKSCGGSSSSSSTSSTSGGSTSSGGSVLGRWQHLVGGTAVPEPGMLGMMAMGLIGLGFARRRLQGLIAPN
jgi:hypothetical protein